MVATPSFDELYNRMWTRLTQTTGITNNSESGFAANITKIVCQEIINLWQELEFLESQGQISTATGSYLEKIGQFFGVYRLKATSSTTLGTPSSVRITNNGVTDITVPGNIRIWASSDPNISYYTVSPVDVVAGSDSYVDVIAGSPGSNYNIGAEVLDRIEINTNTIVVINDIPIINGADIESDNNYRKRIQDEIYRREGPSLTSIRASLLEVPGVRDVTLLNFSRGPGTLDVIIYGYSKVVPNSVISNCQEVLDNEIAAGISAIAKAPISVFLDLEIKVKLKPNANQNAYTLVLAAVRGYVDNLPIEDGSGNGTLIYNELLARVQQSTSDIVDSNIILTVNNSPALRTNQSISIGQRLVSRSINIS